MARQGGAGVTFQKSRLAPEVAVYLWPPAAAEWGNWFVGFPHFLQTSHRALLDPGDEWPRV